MAGNDRYLQTQVMTASPYELHLMVVDGAIRYAKFAQQALERRDFEMSHLSLGKSREFVGELIAGLRGDQQPELIDSLKALFNYAWKNLAAADMTHDPTKVADAIRVLDMHRETWRELGERLKQEAASASMAEPEANPADATAGGESLRGPHFDKATATADAPRLSWTV
jgi:flagellar protein FliS